MHKDIQTVTKASKTSIRDVARYEPQVGPEDAKLKTPLEQQSSSHETLSPPLIQPERSRSTPASQSYASGPKFISDLVRDSKLETMLSNNGVIVRHVPYVSNPRMRQRKIKREETWKRSRELGTGTFGRVWLEERLDGDGAGKLRAVKEIAKSLPQNVNREIDYNRELEAIAEFSHSKVCKACYFSFCSTAEIVLYSTSTASYNRLDGMRATPPSSLAWNILKRVIYKAI